MIIRTCIGKNECLRSDAKLALVVPLAIQELSTKRFARRHVGVHLDPGGAEGLESAFGDLCLDPREQGGVELLYPLELLCLRRGESMLGVTIHEIALRRPRSS